MIYVSVCTRLRYADKSCASIILIKCIASANIVTTAPVKIACGNISAVSQLCLYIKDLFTSASAVQQLFNNLNLYKSKTLCDSNNVYAEFFACLRLLDASHTEYLLGIWVRSGSNKSFSSN